MAALQLRFEQLDARRRELGMSEAVLAKRSGVSLPVVQRILSGKHTTANFANVMAVAGALGVGIEFHTQVDAEKLREQQAWRKAERLVGMVQGTSGLEAQAVDEKTYLLMVRKTAHELLAGPKRRLWGE